MFYVFDKTNNSAVLAVGNFTEVVYKCFPFDIKAMYQGSILISFEKKNISLQNIRFDNDKDNQILSSFVNKIHQLLVGIKKKIYEMLFIFG